MRKLIRLSVLACAIVSALAFAGQALASYTPRLQILQSTYRETATPTSTISVAQGDADDPTAKITIYSALGYSVNLGQAPGTTIGAVRAQVLAADLANARLTLTGPVTVANPASFRTNLCAPGLHDAVWILNASLQGQTLQIPLYVDRARGAEQGFASGKIQVCLPPPDVPPGTPGRSTFGAKLVNATFSASGVFSNPTARGMYDWRSLWTPYAPGTGRPNPAGTVEAQGHIPIPYLLSFSRVKSKLKRILLFGGKLFTAGNPFTGGRVKLYVGTKRTALKSYGRIARTSRTGSYRLAWRKPRKLRAKFMYFQVRRLALSTGCVVTPQLVPTCVGGTISPINSRILRMRVRR
jgi:hypothetical protein